MVSNNPGLQKSNFLRTTIPNRDNPMFRVLLSAQKVFAFANEIHAVVQQHAADEKNNQGNINGADNRDRPAFAFFFG